MKLKLHYIIKVSYKRQWQRIFSQKAWLTFYLMDKCVGGQLPKPLTSRLTHRDIDWPLGSDVLNIDIISTLENNLVAAAKPWTSGIF